MHERDSDGWQCPASEELGVTARPRSPAGRRFPWTRPRAGAMGLAILLFPALAGLAATPATHGASRADSDRIRIYKANPRYWQYKGRPDMLGIMIAAGPEVDWGEVCFPPRDD